MKRGLFPVILLIAAGGWLEAVAHPAHVTIAELGWDESNQMLEVALRVAPEDLVLALERMTGESARLREGPEMNRQLLNLVSRHFRVIPRSAAAGAVPQWVGWETSHEGSWLYFQFPMAPQPLQISNSLLLDVHPQQLNTLTIRHGGTIISAQLHRKEPAMNWSPNPP